MALQSTEQSLLVGTYGLGQTNVARLEAAGIEPSERLDQLGVERAVEAWRRASVDAK